MTGYQTETALQVIDANLDRLREGLRAVEDSVRYHPGFEPYQAELKEARQKAGELEAEIREIYPNLERDARRMEIDSGSTVTGERESVREDLADLVSANFKRAEEACRSLEEYTRLVEDLAELSHRCKALRMQLYSFEGEVIGAARRITATGRGRARVRQALETCPLYPIVDESLFEHRDFPAVRDEVARAGAAGLGILQLRVKQAEANDFLNWALGLGEVCRQEDVILIINDRIDVCAAARAGGVHLGQDDLPLTAAHNQLHGGALVGISTHDFEEAKQAHSGGADYLGFGAVFPTDTKQDTVENSLDDLSKVAELDVPVVAIGGIDLSNARAAYEAGASGFAAISLFNETPMDEAVQRVIDEWRPSAAAGSE